MSVFDLSEEQATYILDMPLRRLTKFSRIELETEADELRSRIAELDEILGDDSRLRGVVSEEFAELASTHGTPRRTTLLEGTVPVASRSTAATSAASALEVPDEPCVVLMSSTGLLARTSTVQDLAGHRRPLPVRHTTSSPPQAWQQHAGAVGRLRPRAASCPSRWLISQLSRRLGCTDADCGRAGWGFRQLEDGEEVIELTPLDGGFTLTLGTHRGVVKRVVVPEAPTRGRSVSIISLAENDRVVGARSLPEAIAEKATVVFVTSEANLLRFPASTVRVQGAGAGGMAGVSLPLGASVVFCTAIPEASLDAAVLACVAGDSRVLARYRARFGETHASCRHTRPRVEERRGFVANASAPVRTPLPVRGLGPGQREQPVHLEPLLCYRIPMSGEMPRARRQAPDRSDRGSFGTAGAGAPMSPPPGTQGALTDASCSRRASWRVSHSPEPHLRQKVGWSSKSPAPGGATHSGTQRYRKRWPTGARNFDHEHSIRTIAARHPSRRRLDPQAPRNIWLAICLPGRQQLRHLQVQDLKEVCSWDLSPLATDELPDIGRPLDQPLEFICTHSARDTCCAVLGRQALARAARAWECSHLGGHRFAATSLILPEGNCFGRLAPDDDRDTSHLRGATHLAPDLQVAEIAVRMRMDLDPSAPLRTARHIATGTAEVRDADGHRWMVRCEQHTTYRPASCQAEPSEAHYWRAVSVEPWKENLSHGH